MLFIDRAFQYRFDLLRVHIGSFIHAFKTSIMRPVAILPVFSFVVPPMALLASVCFISFELVIALLIPQRVIIIRFYCIGLCSPLVIVELATPAYTHLTVKYFSFVFDRRLIKEVNIH